eukprot:EG_transcript_24783
MEEAYVIRRRADVQHIARLWCGVQLFLCLLWFSLSTVRYREFSRPSWEDFLPFLAIAAVFASHAVPRLRAYTHILIIASPLVVMGYNAWRVHWYVVQETLMAEAYSLNHAFEELQGSVAAVRQLQTYVNVEVSKKVLMVAGVQMLTQLNVLQFLGLNYGTALLCFLFPASLTLTAFLSPVVASNILEVTLLCSAISLINLLCSCMISRMQRQRFAVDHELQVSLEREAETLQRLADHEKRAR